MLDAFAHEMDHTQSRMDGVLRKMAKVSHMTNGKPRWGGSSGVVGGGRWYLVPPPPVTSDPFAPRPPTVVCHRRAAGGAASGSCPALLPLTPALPRAPVPLAVGAGRVLPPGRRGSFLESCLEVLIRSQWDPRGPGPEPLPLGNRLQAKRPIASTYGGVPGLAQSVERGTLDLKVLSSSPTVDMEHS